MYNRFEISSIREDKEPLLQQVSWNSNNLSIHEFNQFGLEHKTFRYYTDERTEELIQDIEDPNLQNMLYHGLNYCRINENIAVLNRHLIGQDEILEMQYRRIILDKCVNFCSTDLSDVPSAYDISNDEIQTVVNAIESFSNGNREYVQKQAKTTKQAFALYMHYFGLERKENMEHEKMEIAFFLYISRLTETYSQHIEKTIFQVLNEKQKAFIEQGLDTTFLEQLRPANIFVDFNMFNRRGSRGNPSLIDKSAIIHIHRLRPSKDLLLEYANTVIHELIHHIVNNVHEPLSLEQFDSMTVDEILANADDDFNFEEVLVELLSHIEDPNNSTNDYSHGVKHLAHILEQASRESGSDPNEWKTPLLDLITKQSKTNIFQAIADWYDSRKPKKYGSFIEEMFIYTNGAIIDEFESCSSFQEALSKWEWLRLAQRHNVGENILLGVFNAMGEYGHENGHPNYIDLHDKSIRSLL